MIALTVISSVLTGVNHMINLKKFQIQQCKISDKVLTVILVKELSLFDKVLNTLTGNNETEIIFLTTHSIPLKDLTLHNINNSIDITWNLQRKGYYSSMYTLQITDPVLKKDINAKLSEYVYTTFLMKENS